MMLSAAGRLSVSGAPDCQVSVSKAPQALQVADHSFWVLRHA
ncbi:MAG: hypothetical protein ACK59B_07090 [Alphaproteobacteria bacterium]